MSLLALPAIFASGGVSLPPTFWTQRVNNFTIRGVTSNYDGTYWVAAGANGELQTATDPTGTWTLRSSAVGTDQIPGCYYDGSTYWVIVTTAGKLATATDPTGTWTLRTSSFGTDIINGVAHDQSTYWVAVGINGKLATATDPTGTWTQRTSSFGSSDLYAVAYDGTYWTAVGQGGKIAYATDPTGTWTQNGTTAFGTSTLRGVEQGNGFWVASGQSGKIGYATDPTGTWTLATSPFGSDTVYSPQYADDKNAWTAGATGGKLATCGKSPAGTWTLRTSSFGSSVLRDVAYGSDGNWVAVGTDAKIATGSEHPYTFTDRTLNCGTSPWPVYYDGSSTWTCCSSDGAASSDISTSADGITWTNRETNKNQMYALHYDGTYWVAAGASGYMLTATDPTSTWTSRTSSFTANINGLWYASSTWVAVGNSGELATASDPTSTWTQRTSSFGTDDINGVAYDGSTYWLAVGDDGAMATSSAPTSSWEQVSSTSFGTSDIYGCAYSSDLSLWIACGVDGKIARASDPTGTWTQCTNPFGSELLAAVVWDPNKDYFIVASVTTSNVAYSDDGINWTLRDTGQSGKRGIAYGNSLIVATSTSGVGVTSY
jgi:hypothetical protein